MSETLRVKMKLSAKIYGVAISVGTLGFLAYVAPYPYHVVFDEGLFLLKFRALMLVLVLPAVFLTILYLMVRQFMFPDAVIGPQGVFKVGPLGKQQIAMADAITAIEKSEHGVFVFVEGKMKWRFPSWKYEIEAVP